MATRCCWPPESSEGRCERRSPSPTAADQLLDPGRRRASRLRFGSGQDDVLLRRQHRKQVEELEDEADVLAPQLRQLRVVQPPISVSAIRDVAGGRLVEPREDVHQRRLARAGGPITAVSSPVGHVDRDAAQGVHGRLVLAVLAG